MKGQFLTLKRDNGMDESKKLEIHYQKTNTFRNIYVSGVHGGAATNKDLIFMNVFMDRVPIPQKMIVELDVEGKVSPPDENGIEGKKGVIREVESCLIFDLSTAIEIKKWLDDKIKVLSKGKGTE